MNIFVTGATRGIGRSIVLHFLSNGHTVIYTFKSNKEASEQFDKEHPNAHGFQCDVNDKDACDKTVQEVLEKFKQIHVLVNNAGITSDKSFLKMTYEQWVNVINTNLISLFTTTNAIYQNMVSNNFGRIINITSIVGQKGAFGQANYAASKAGVIGFTKALALEAASKNVTVNAVAPGYIATEMTDIMPEDVLSGIVKKIPQSRLGTTDEVAQLVYFLSSPHAEYITGQTISVNGGLQ